MHIIYNVHVHHIHVQVIVHLHVDVWVILRTQQLIELYTSVGQRVPHIYGRYASEPITTHLIHGQRDDVQLVLEGSTVEDGVRIAIFTVHILRVTLQEGLHNSVEIYMLYIHTTVTDFTVRIGAHIIFVFMMRTHVSYTNTLLLSHYIPISYASVLYTFFPCKCTCTLCVHLGIFYYHTHTYIVMYCTCMHHVTQNVQRSSLCLQHYLHSSCTINSESTHGRNPMRAE